MKTTEAWRATCAAALLACSVAAGAAQQVDFAAVARQVSSGAELDQAVPKPPRTLLAQKRSQVLAKFPGSQAEIDRAGAGLSEDALLDYYNKLLGLR